MTPQPFKRPHVVFLFSDTGGGHRSAAEAIIEALRLEYQDRLTTEMVDIFKDYAPRPLKYMPTWYPYFVRVPSMWGLGYHLSDGRWRTHLLNDSAWPLIRRSLQNLIARHPSDLIVSVHPLANTPVLRALGKNRPPFITVVTDLVTAHAFWYDSQTDLCLVPTEAARQRALKCRLAPGKVQVVGLPVADRFCQAGGDRDTIRARLGWPLDLPMILLVGGGEGMGPLERTAQAIASARLPAALAVVTGRNQALKARLEAQSWPLPTFLYGFVREMPNFMIAADILVTKAGPGTISEALNAGLPMVLYSRLPGQEDGNVVFVVSEGAGVWAPQPDQIVEAVRQWVEHPEERLRASQAGRRAAKPQAARQIARILAERAGLAE